MRMAFLRMTSKLLCLLSICTVLPGCMSIAGLGDDGSAWSNGIYRGVRADVDCIRFAQDDTKGMELFCGLDLPLSLALDTVFLPFTLVDTLTRTPEASP